MKGQSFPGPSLLCLASAHWTTVFPAAVGGPSSLSAPWHHPGPTHWVFDELGRYVYPRDLLL